MKRRELRQHIFELLFRVEFNPAGEMEEQLTLFFEALKGEREITEQDEAYIREKYEKIAENLPALDARINEAAQGWNTARMGKVELTILRLAVYEMLFDEDVPKGVAIDEAVEIAKKFGQDNSGGFVNAILAKISKLGD